MKSAGLMLWHYKQPLIGGTIQVPEKYRNIFATGNNKIHYSILPETRKDLSQLEIYLATPENNEALRKRLKAKRDISVSELPKLDSKGKIDLSDHLEFLQAEEESHLMIGGAGNYFTVSTIETYSEGKRRLGKFLKEKEMTLMGYFGYLAHIAKKANNNPPKRSDPRS